MSRINNGSVQRLMSKGLGHLLQLAISVVVLMALVASVRAQGTGDIVGTVTDETGAAVIGAKVTTKNLDTSLTRTVVTNAAGEYVLSLLPVGNYRVSIESPGFKLFTVPQFAIAAGDRPRVNVQMEVGELAQAVEVAGQAAALQTETAVVGGLVTTQAVQDLPVNGRNFIKLVQLAPGANEGPQSSLSGGTRPDDRRQTSTVSANGQSAESNNYLLDGMDNNERSISTIIVKPSIDAMEEVKVETNLYSAEYGRAGGAVINMITKSGTNGFHGSLFEFLRNDKVDAKSFFNVPQPGNPLAGKQTEFRQNQFGASLGGPIIKDKTFFFADYEGFRKVQGQTRVLTLPTACELGKAACGGVTQLGNFSDLGDTIYDPTTYNAATNSTTPFANNIIPTSKIDSIGANYAALFPALPASGCTTTCQYVGSPTISQFAHTADLRIDQRFSDADLFYARYSINNTQTITQSYLPPVKLAGILVQPSGTGNANFPGTANQRQQSIGFSHVHIFRPNLLLHLNAQLARYVSDSEGPNAGVNVNTAFGGPVNGNTSFPGTDGLLQAAFQDGGYTALGDAFALPTQYFDTNYLFGGSATWTKGTHSITFGASFLKRDFSQYQIDTKGVLSFSSTESDSTAGDGSGQGGNSFASLLMGFPENFDREEQPIAPQYRSYELGEFIQDAWRATRWLTLNFGVRYDIFSPLSEKHNTISNFDPTIPSVLASGMMQVAGVNGVSRTLNIKTQFNNIQPRLGFAATTGHGMVVRGGFGLSYYPNNVASPANFKNQPWGIIYTPETALGAVPTLRLKDPLPAPAFLPACLTAACGPDFPFYVSASTQVDYHYSRLYQYNLTVEKEIGANLMSVGYVGQNGRHLGRVVPNMNVPLPPQGPGGCGVTHTISLPDPCQPYYNIMPQNTGLQLLETNGISNYSALQMIFQRRYSAGLTVAANYTFSHGLADVGGAGGPCSTCAQVLNNFARDYGNSDFMVKHRIAITGNYALPFAKGSHGVTSVLAKGWQLNGIYSYSTGLPFTVTNGRAQTNIGGGADRPNAVPQGSFTQNLNEWFDIAAFRFQPFGTAGNEGRNQFSSPASFRTDASVFKDFRIWEQVKLQFRVEAFNITNSPTFAPPTVRASKWTGTGPTAVPTAAGNFGKVTANNAFYTPRDIQFALKLLF